MGCACTRVGTCVCVLSVPGRAVGSGVCGFVPLSREGLRRDRGDVVPGGARLGQPKQRVLRPSLWSFTWAEVLLSHSAAPIPVPDPQSQVPRPIIPGGVQLGRGSIFFCAASEIPSPRQANHSICAFRSLKIHGILPVLGMAGAVHPAARTGTEVPTLHPGMKGWGVFGPLGGCGWCPVGSWPLVVGMARPRLVSPALGRPGLVTPAWAWGLRQGCVIYCTLLQAEPRDGQG